VLPQRVSNSSIDSSDSSCCRLFVLIRVLKLLNRDGNGYLRQFCGMRRESGIGGYRILMGVRARGLGFGGERCRSRVL
jgi:hypothetical protein